jgi:Protein of unknown function (DUF4236)
MGFRFRKILKIAPGVKLNISKRGVSASLGKRGASFNIGGKGTRTTIGAPGTGISYSTYSRHKSGALKYWLFVLLVIVAAAYFYNLK